MMFGIIEVFFALALGAMLPSDQPPLDAATVLRGMPADCEFMAFQDLRVIDQRIERYLDLVRGQEWLTANSEWSALIERADHSLDEYASQASTFLGFDPFTELVGVGICAKLSQSSDGEPVPSFQLVLQTVNPIDISSRVGMLDRVDIAGQSLPGFREDGMTVGIYSLENAVVVGTSDYLTPLLSASTWAGVPAPDVPHGSLLGRLNELVPSGVTSYVAVRPSVPTRFLINSSHAPATFTQLIAGLDSALATTNGQAIHFELKATDAAVHEDFSLILQGLGHLSEASPLAAEGMIRVMLGIFSETDPHVDSELRPFLAHREEVLSLLDELGFSGQVEATFAEDTTAMLSTLDINNAQSLVYTY
ncbi:MAG: hypothetical protein KC561_10590, partial [Myxococcales bacterium]|nr:hypothetical protein [Myxococcales bacterium]